MITTNWERKGKIKKKKEGRDLRDGGRLAGWRIGKSGEGRWTGGGRRKKGRGVVVD